MQVRMIFGTVHGRKDLRAQSTQDLPEDLARQLIRQGRAEAVEPDGRASSQLGSVEVRDPKPRTRDPKVK